MRCLINVETDPYWNLAAEEYLLTSSTQPILRLWRNDNAIIVGRHQNTLSQIYLPYIREHQIKVVRRLSGGGAVYHDLGNVNFSFFDARPAGEDTLALFTRFTRPILDALNALGVKAYLHGRNDILIDGRKCSGNAIALHQNRILVHGTLLFSSFLTDMGKMLRPKADPHVQGTGVPSRPAGGGVCNISQFLSAPMTVEAFISHLQDFIARDYPVETSYTPEETKAIEKLRTEKYNTDAWNYGASPRYDFRKELRFPAGTVEVMLQVKDGIITDARIYGDYFFLRPTKEMEALLLQCPHNPQAVAERLANVPVASYFQGLSASDLLSCMF